MSLTNADPSQAALEAKTAALTLATLSAEDRNAALDAIHAGLLASKDAILEANARDMGKAREAAAGGSLSQSLVARLDLGKPGKFEDMLKGIRDVKELDDPGMILLRFQILLHTSLSLPRSS